jgi:iron complex transport system ATP-binding protein
MSSAFREILRLKDVSFSYSNPGFIEGLGLSLGAADFVGLLGANGSGKSTILKLLAGILKPGAGEVELWGKPVGTYRNRDRAKLVSYLPQALDMGVPFSVGELARMGLYPYDRPTGMDLEEALRLVGLSGRADTLISRLSGGERRRAYIAMTLLQGAGILLLDEPLANLDIRYQVELLRLLEELNEKRSITILMALHDVNLAFGFRKLLLIKEGRLIGEGAPGDVLGEGLLREAFGIDIRVVSSGNESFISYRDGGDIGPAGRKNGLRAGEGT